MKWLPVLIVALLLSACSTKTPSVQTKQVGATAQQIVQGCISKGSLLIHSGRSTIEKCIAPPGHEKAFVACAEGQLLHVHSRATAEKALVMCAENNR